MIFTFVMLKQYICGVVCKLANYIFINFKTYLGGHGSDFDDL